MDFETHIYYQRDSGDGAGETESYRESVEGQRRELAKNNEEGGRYGVPKEIWEEMTPSERNGIAQLYFYADPLRATLEGIREIKETMSLSLYVDKVSQPDNS